jgi:hypothetical protein
MIVRLRLKSPKDFWSGCSFIAFGAATVVLSQAHPLGTAARMGPGYFPTVLGAMLAGIGLIILLKSLLGSPESKGVRVNLALMLRLLAAVAAFAFLLNPLGLVLTAVVVVALASAAGHEFRLGEAIASGIALAAFSYLLFVRTLGQTMSVWPSFLTG